MKKIYLALALSATLLAAHAAPPLEKATSSQAGLQEITAQKMPKKGPRRAIAPYSLPVTFPIATADEIAGYTTVDGNGDGMTWKYESSSACYEGIGVTVAANDWLILPAVYFNAPEASYNLSIQAKQTYKAETFEICLSPTMNVADAFSVAQFNSLANSWEQLDATFALATPGEYFVMIHATTPSAGISLYVKDLRLSANVPKTYTVPFFMQPEAEDVKDITFIDANADGKTFKFDTSYNGLSYEYNKDLAADDYALLPSIDITEAGNYKFSWHANGYGTSIEHHQILMGQGADPATYTPIFTDNEVGKNGYRREVVVNIHEPGRYRFAIHCTSPANRMKLLVKEFRLEATDEPVATALPLQQNDPIVVTETGFSHPFLLSGNARVKISFDYKGDEMSIGQANAPAAAALNALFTVDAAADFTHFEKAINISGNGITFLGFTAGSAEVKNLSISIITPEEEAYQLPFQMQPLANQFNEFITIDANNDNSAWSYYESFGAARYNYSAQNKANDWLILPAINVPDVNNMLRFSVNVRGMGAAWGETFEVYAGKTVNPAEMTLLFSSPEIRSEEFAPVEFSFTPAWSGITFFAVKATSEPKQFHLFLRDFSIAADGRTADVPRPIEALEATPVGMGSLKANLKFRMPTLAENGSELPADGYLKANITTRATSVSYNATPGQEFEIEVESGQGMGNITVTAQNASGESNPLTTKVYTGQDIPAPVSSIVLSENASNRQVNIKWTAETTGANGGYADPELCSYTIYHSLPSTSLQPIGTVKNAYEYSFSVPESYPLEMHYFTVKATNVAGDSELPTSKGITLGKAHAIPCAEEFADGTIQLGPVAMSNPDSRYTLNWYYDNPAIAFDESANASGRALIAFSEDYGEARGRLHLPKFDTRSDNGARVILRIFNYPHCATTEVWGKAYGVQPVLIGTIQPTQQAEWHEYSLPLPAELLGKEWVEIYADFGFAGTEDDEIWMLDRYGIDHYFDKELDLRPILTQNRMYAWDDSQWLFSVGNYGREPISFTAPQLNFTTYNGDVLSFNIAKTNTEITLNPGETTRLAYTANLHTGMEGELLYDISIPVDGDGNPDNNYLVGATALRQQQEYVVRDLQAERVGESEQINLAWSAPAADSGLLNCENLESWDYSSRIGLFRNIDADGLPTLQFVGAPYPGSGAAKGWQVWDPMDAGFDIIYLGYLASDKSLIVFGPADGQTAADDWLISPEIQGGTDISFFVRPLNYNYGRETIEILTSSKSDNPADFRLLTSFSTKAGESGKTPYWEDVTARLPLNARYFAIRYVSKDIFGLQLDDLTYTPAQGPADISYTLMRDGQTIATGLKQTEATDMTATPGTYHVAAERFYGGLHPLSNPARVETSGVDEITALNPAARYYNLQGLPAQPASGEIAIEVINGATRKIRLK